MISSTMHLTPGRDRRGRGRRGVLLPPTVPGWQTRREFFSNSVILSVQSLQRSLPQISYLEFGVEDVPPSDPTPWEPSSAVLGRAFDADRGRGLKPRVVLYRLPIAQRCTNRIQLARLIHMVLVENIAAVLGLAPDKVDPQWNRGRT